MTPICGFVSMWKYVPSFPQLTDKSLEHNNIVNWELPLAMRGLLDSFRALWDISHQVCVLSLFQWFQQRAFSLVMSCLNRDSKLSNNILSSHPKEEKLYKVWLLYVTNMTSAYVLVSSFYPVLIICWVYPSYYISAYKFRESKDHVSSLITFNPQVINSMPTSIWWPLFLTLSLLPWTSSLLFPIRITAFGEMPHISIDSNFSSLHYLANRPPHPPLMGELDLS